MTQTVTNRLLQRQLRKFFKNPEALPAEFRDFVRFVSDSYDHYEEDRKLLERAMELSSAELFAANQTVTETSEYQKRILLKISEMLEEISQCDKSKKLSADENPAFLVSMLAEQIELIKSAQEKLRASENSLLEAQEIAGLGSWEVDLLENKASWSRQVYKQYGRSADLSAPMNDEYYSLLHPEDVDALKQCMLEAAEKGECALEQRVIHSDGSIRYLTNTVRTVYAEDGSIKGFYGTSHDITHRRQAEERIRNSEANLNALIENTIDTAWSVDLNLQLIICNSAYKDAIAAQTGKEPQTGEAVNFDAYPEEFRGDWVAYYERAIAGERFTTETPMLIEGEIIPFEHSFNPIIDISDKVVGVAVFGRNIQERKLAETELVEAKDKAENAAMAKAQFLSTMSHEIRTPMNAVIGITHLLLQDEPKPEQMENLKTLRFSAENLLVLINDILDFSKIEAGKIDFEEVDFSLSELLSGIRHSFAYKAEEKHIRLRIRKEEDIPDVLVGDPTRLAQVLTNLVGNAVKFTEKGSITLDIELNKRDDKQITLDFIIEDTGIGIPQDKIDTIFDRFTQAGANTTRKYGGTGLGLSIVKRLVEMQGSSVHLESIEGKGSKFSFSLTFRHSSRSSVRNRSYQNLGTFKSLKGVNLLLVEDNPINVMVARQFLNKWDISVDYAENGRIAVEKIQAKDYDVVLMDLQMPEMDGYTASRLIRELPDEKYKKLPIIALTASAMLEVQDQVFKTGMTDYVTKPFNPSDLYNKIAMHTQGLEEEEMV
ncbi:MAG: ATP-binding protein [Bacteroidota bacterium]